MKLKRRSLAVGFVVLCLVVGTSQEGLLAGPVTTDLWDISQGASVTDHSGVMSGWWGYSDINNMFGTISPDDAGNQAGKDHTIFRDDRSAGFLHWVEWQTPDPIVLDSFSLFAKHDINNTHQRAFDLFTLYADGVEIYTLTAANPYGDTVNPYLTSGASNELNLELVDVGAVTAQTFRAEFRQLVPNGQWGPRIIELDGFGSSVPIPEPATLALLFFGLGAVGIGGWRRKRKAAS